MSRIWTCKIGIRTDARLPGGADEPMRIAVARAFKDVTGLDAEFCFSGWGTELTTTEERVVEERAREGRSGTEGVHVVGGVTPQGGRS